MDTGGESGAVGYPGALDFDIHIEGFRVFHSEAKHFYYRCCSSCCHHRHHHHDDDNYYYYDHDY